MEPREGTVKKMNIDEFFEWHEKYCREHHYGGMSAQSVCITADAKGVDLGSIIWVGRKHLIPRGWIRHITTRGSSIYLLPGTVLPKTDKASDRGTPRHKDWIDENETETEILET